MRDRVTEYAERVVSGDVPCGELHLLACQRHLDDLARQGTEEFPYFWDVKASDNVLDYSESLTIIEGFEPKPVKLIPSQAFGIGCTFGWKKENGYRRFRRRYKSMARQQGKTFENGILGTYIAGFGGYRYGKLFTVATKKKQARLAWEEMQKFIEADDNLKEFFDIKDYKSLITATNTDCTIEALSRDAGLDDGFRAIYASIDELHQHRDNKVYKALYNGTRNLPETLLSMITTRGDNLNSFGYEMDEYAVNVLRGTVIAEDFFVDIHCLDEGDDPFDEYNWIKSNPLLASTEEGMEQIRIDAQTAKDMGGSELTDFLTKCMNIWVENTDNQFIDKQKWKENGCDLTLEDFRGERCWVGLDLSSGGDLTTLSLEFEEGDDGAYVYSHSFMPRGRLMEHIATDLAPYDLWEANELLTVTGGAGDFKNDYKFIIKTLRDLKEEYDLHFEGIGLDPHNADGILGDLEEFGCPIILVTQSARNLNDATQDVQILVKSGKYRYNRLNGLLSWSFANTKLTYNSFGECKVDKNYGKFKRVDPADACIDAHFCRMSLVQEEEIDVDEVMQNYLESMGWN